MKMKFLLFIIGFNFFIFSVKAQKEVEYTTQDIAVFDTYAKHIEPFRKNSKEEILQKTAEFFIDCPYTANTLDKNLTEKLIVNLREFDCFTFVETVIALSNIAAMNSLTFDEFTTQLRKNRYRKGLQGDYASRLHYTSDWVFDNEKKGLVENISKHIGGIKELKIIDFMSSHRDSYNQLKNNNILLHEIKKVESNINKRNGFYYLQKAKIAACSKNIPNMSIIGFTTQIKGLDTTHVGFAYKKNGILTFIHASSTEKKVTVDNKSLSDYCFSQKKCTGIMVINVL